MYPIFLGLALAAGVFTIVVFVHELGHFLAARLCKVKVEEFGLGLPPRLARVHTDRRGTEWTLNWLPIGGFVRLLGERREGGDAPRPDALWARPIAAQMAVVLAGVFFNFILAFAVLTGAFMAGVSPLGVNRQFAQVETALLPTYDQALREGILVRTPGALLGPIEGSPAALAGLKGGDLATAVDGKPVATPEEFVAAVGAAKMAVRITVASSGALRDVTVTLSGGKIGVYVGDDVRAADFRYRMGFFPAARLAASETWAQSKLLVFVLGDLVRKGVSGNAEERHEAAQAVSGPVAIGDFFVQYAKVSTFDWAAVVAIAALISLNLGVFNLLPLPALDGGRFAFLCVASVGRLFGRDWVGGRVERAVHGTGFVFLLALAAAVTYKDVASIFMR